MCAVILAMLGEFVVCMLVWWVLMLGVKLLIIGARLLRFVIGLLVLSPLILLAWLLFPFFLDAAVWVLFAFYHVMSWLWIVIVWCVKVVLWIVGAAVVGIVALELLKKIRS